jgi:hypothetical protein
MYAALRGNIPRRQVGASARTGTPDANVVRVSAVGSRRVFRLIASSKPSQQIRQSHPDQSLALPNKS